MFAAWNKVIGNIPLLRICILQSTRSINILSLRECRAWSETLVKGKQGVAPLLRGDQRGRNGKLDSIGRKSWFSPDRMCADKMLDRKFFVVHIARIRKKFVTWRDGAAEVV